MVSISSRSTTKSSSYVVALLTFLQHGSNGNRFTLAALVLLVASMALKDVKTTLALLDSVLVDWIPQTVIPFYTLTTILYLSLRYFHDGSVLQAKKRLAAKQKLPTPTLGAPPSQADSAASGPPPPIDLSGCYKLMENHNFEALLQAQGVPWFLVSAANKARPTHRITHTSYNIRIKIEGIIESETLYIVGGPPVETVIRGRLFRDQVSYMKWSESLLDQNDTEGSTTDASIAASGSRIVGIQTHKRAVDDGYTILVQRRLTDDKSQIILTSRVQFDDDAKADIQSKQIFYRIE